MPTAARDASIGMCCSPLRSVFQAWRSPVLLCLLTGAALSLGPTQAPGQQAAVPLGRPAANDAELAAWLRSMAVDHRYSLEEMAQALALEPDAVRQALPRLSIDPAVPPDSRHPGDPLKVLPYPGGRHPRLGFLDGAVDPQRETKVSIFPPWNDGGYAVADVPEAIWFAPAGERQLLYLAHTHVPTIWTRQGIELPRLEWQHESAGRLLSRRSLPNGVTFAAEVQPRADGVRLTFSITNGSAENLTGLDVQMCVMLGHLRGFEAQTGDNKRFDPPLAACHDETGRRWIITGFQRAARVWGNAPCPCLHSDPRLEDCPPGQSRKVRGWVSFYEGEGIDEHLHALSERVFADP